MLPSYHEKIHQENFGIAVVEALACGKLVLISDQVNICREIDCDHAGIFRPDTLAGTIKLMQTFIQLPTENRRTMEAAAGASFQANFSIQEAAARMLQAISSH